SAFRGWTAASAFLIVQLQRLAPRDTSVHHLKAKNAFNCWPSSTFRGWTAASAFLAVQLQPPAASGLRSPPCDKSTSNRYALRVSFISVAVLQSIRR
ncbi:hypothetical protein, partial [Mesobacillus campisalis]